MAGKRKRRLGSDERELWERVAATARPLRSFRPVQPTTPPWVAPEPSDEPAGAPAVDPSSRPAPISVALPSAPRAAQSTAIHLAAPDAAPVGRPQAGLDRRTAERLRKGARAPDARIDLHGLTAERAHHACLRFLGEAVARRHRVVLVITGKGRGGRSGRAGVLRDALPGWLRASPLGRSIVGIYQAHRRHGGEGAFYVYLKRQR
jgi:DNA-nicking Smr family endonuclease